MKRPGAAVAAALAACAIGAGVAQATATHDRDDVATSLDIAKAAGAHNRASDELVHTVDFYGPVTPASMVTNKGKPPSTVCVEIWTRSTPRESPPDYEACAGAAKGGKAWTASIARKRERGAQLRIGSVKVEQPSDTRLVLRIDPGDIKRPASYRWRTESTSFGADCANSSGCADYAPDRPATAETRLSTPRA
ncbi:MAG TPA: hypothetical protein VE570_08990 [Thermoleophilaceae bacterium]|jgi:hypothetical protein|nr:hypothetical protein [Thermoleophilaceae bacterium]